MHEKNKFRLVLFFSKIKTENIFLEIDTNVCSRGFSSNTNTHDLFSFIFCIFHEYHRIHIASNNIKYISAWFNFHGTNTKNYNLFSILSKITATNTKNYNLFSITLFFIKIKFYTYLYEWKWNNIVFNDVYIKYC